MANLNIDFDSYVQAFQNIYKVTCQPKHRAFQYRLLHSAIILNQHLYRWKMKGDNLCTNCKKEKEHALHFFVLCEHAKKIWEWIRQFCHQMSPDEVKEFSDRNIMLNLVNCNPKHVFNYIVLITKTFMYSKRCLQKEIRKHELYAIIWKYRNFELYYAKANEKLSYHMKKWSFVKNDQIRNNLTGLETEYVEKVYCNA